MHNTSEDFTSLLASITTIMANVETSLSESFFQEVLYRLDSFNYIYDVDHDAWLIAFAMQKVESHIKNECNIPEIPEGFVHSAVDMVCGEFLYSKNQSGQLDIDGLDLTGTVSSIKEGDTSVNFATSQSDDMKFDALIDYLKNSGKGDLICFRRLHW